VLGVVSCGDYQSFTVADIPGLIEGASEGAGMGIRFLKHIERTRLFLHLIDLKDPEHPDPWKSFLGIRKELESYSSEFSKRTQWVVLTKRDQFSDPDLLKKAMAQFESRGYRVFAISAVTGEGLDFLIQAVGEEVRKKAL
ncbi:MAG: GTPase, partial [bacterium]|nr:GTPase [bacterium]